MADDEFDRLDTEWRNMTGRAMYYSRDGEPWTTRQWIAAHEAVGENDPEAWNALRRVASDSITLRSGRTYLVSTVWLGLDHQWGDGPPLIFETMIFTDDEKLDNWCQRYSTEAEALAGHRYVVDAIQRNRLDDLG